MKHFSTVLTLLLLTVFSSNYEASAQGTWDKIYTIMETNCSGASSGCHSGGSAYSFTFDDGQADLYDRLYNGEPINPYAKNDTSRSNRLIYPAQPANSFFLRKIAHCMDGDLQLKDPEEGEAMPKGEPEQLPDSTVELVRQWILAGAPETGTIHNEKTISDYYKDPSAHVSRMYPKAPPRACEGFQIHLGPIFLEPNEEVEYFMPYDLGFDEDIEVTRVEVKMNEESHHFILYSLDSADAANKPQGLREIGADAFGGSFVNAWQSDDSYELPNGTAFKWRSDRVLDLNYHIYNSNSDKILLAEVYLNVYTQPLGTAEKEMKSTLITIDPITSLYIPPYDPNDPDKITKFTEEVVRSSWDTISIFMLSTHTHSWGDGYDIFRRDPAASDKKGEMLYDGEYSFDYTFDAGQYDWEHPAVRRFDPLMPVDMNLGLVHEARYKNREGDEPVGCIPTIACPAPSWTNISWSFETTGEMMLIYLQYVDGTYEIPNNPIATAQCDASEPFPEADPCDNFIPEDTTGIYDIALNEESVKVYPNPFQGSTNIV
ncbi:MAG: hypothetical protein WD334_03940, partial [Chitinophagales bacterium]